jgi:hypothetical protein
LMLNLHFSGGECDTPHNLFIHDPCVTTGHLSRAIL